MIMELIEKMNQMKQNRYIIKEVLAVLVLLFSFSNVMAQTDVQENTPAAFELMKSRSQWRQTTNSGGLLLDKPIKYTELGITYTNYGGSFHRPQEGGKGNGLNFNTEGAVILNNVYAWGSFDYSRNTDKDVNYNSSITDPFRGMPFMVADTNSSEWKHQIYDLKFRVATPKFSDKISLGLEGSYLARSAGKQRDLRSENYFYQLTLKPGVVYSVNSKHHIGANFEYYNIKESSKMSRVNTDISYSFWELHGAGASIVGTGVGERSADYQGNNLGGGLQYNYQGDIDLLFSANYDFKVEDVTLGTERRNDASVKDRIWNTKLQLRKENERIGHFLTLEYTDRDIDGIQYVTQKEPGQGWITYHKNIRSTYKTQTATLDYDFVINRASEYTWKLGLGLKYENREDTYLLPHSEKNAENIAFQLRGKKNIFISDVLTKRLLVGADVSYNNNLSGKFDYNGETKDRAPIISFTQTDLNYLVSDFYSFGLNAIYSQNINEKTKANLFAKADFRYTKTSDFDFNNRHVVQITVGCNF